MPDHLGTIIAAVCVVSGCLRVFEPSETNHEELLRTAPVVRVLFPDEARRVDRVGSAWVLSRVDLLLSPHQIPPGMDDGSVLVTGHSIAYKTIAKITGPHGASGWQHIRLAEPIPCEACGEPIQMDCETPLRPGHEVFVAGFPQGVERLPAGQGQRQKTLVSGRVLASVPELPSEFIPVKLEFEGIAHGASGGPVLARFSPEGPWRIVGILGGGITAGDQVIHAVRRPTEFERDSVRESAR